MWWQFFLLCVAWKICIASKTHLVCMFFYETVKICSSKDSEFALSTYACRQHCRHISPQFWSFCLCAYNITPVLLLTPLWLSPTNWRKARTASGHHFILGKSMHKVRSMNVYTYKHTHTHDSWKRSTTTPPPNSLIIGPDINNNFVIHFQSWHNAKEAINEPERYMFHVSFDFLRESNSHRVLTYGLQ